MNIKDEEELAIEDKLIEEALIGKYRAIYSMRRRAKEIGYDIQSSYTSTGSYLGIKVNKKVVGRQEALLALITMQRDFPEFISKGQLFSGERWINKNNPLSWLPRGFGKYKTLYNYYLTLPPPHFIITLHCSLKNKKHPTCNVFLDRE